MSTLPTIVELSCDDAIVTYTNKFFRAIYSEAGPIDVVEYADKWVTFLAIITNVDLTDAQVASLKTQIEAISGVYEAFPRIGPYQLPTDRVQEGYELFVGIQASVKIKPEPVV